MNDLYNLDDKIAFIAWELARWQPGLNLPERQAVILLVLLTLVQDHQGSTRVALRGTRGQALRQEFTRSLLGGIETTAGCDPLDPARAAELMLKVVDAGSLGSIMGAPGSFKPLIDAGSHLYLQKMFELENRFTGALKAKLVIPAEPQFGQKIEAALLDVLSKPAVSAQTGKPVQLNDEQQQAVRMAVQNAVSIISGGPGTGKTTIVLSILRVLRRLGINCQEIALAAPTGKAANRMGDAIRSGREDINRPTEADRDLVNLAEPQTLHRLLGYSHRTSRFQHHHNNRLAERVVIVDESSMIDLDLMDRLIRSLRDDARFILLGDAHQLPSVEAGSVLRDLLTVREAHIGMQCIELVESHRMRRDDPAGRNILTVAQTIDRAETPPFTSTVGNDSAIVERASVSDIAFVGVEFLSSKEGSNTLENFLDLWHEKRLLSVSNFDELVSHDYHIDRDGFQNDGLKKLEQLFSHWGKSRILCLTRVRPTGADRINASLHERALKRAIQLQRPNENKSLEFTADFVSGEPVLMQVNDYERGIYNGDQGIILNVNDHGNRALMVVFRQPHGFAVFPIGSLRPVLRHAYAMTVHKSQGSEFDHVALVLPDRDLPINTPEILYTAITRSRTSVVIVGQRDIFESGVKRAITRDSGIAEKLRA